MTSFTKVAFLSSLIASRLETSIFRIISPHLAQPKVCNSIETMSASERNDKNILIR